MIALAVWVLAALTATWAYRILRGLNRSTRDCCRVLHDTTDDRLRRDWPDATDQAGLDLDALARLVREERDEQVRRLRIIPDTGDAS